MPGVQFNSPIKYNPLMHIELDQAIQLLQDDLVIAIPTETVYGLAALLSSESAIGSIFTLKNRPAKNPLIVHIADHSQAEPLMRTKPPFFDKLSDRYWPGPLTLVVPASDQVPSIVRAGLPTVGLRVPNHPLTRALLRDAGPLVAPSANISGRPSSTCPNHVENDFGENFPVLSGGSCDKGLESTILVFNNGKWELGRLGAIPREELESFLGYSLNTSSSEKPLCPGQHFQHYSPKAKLILSKAPFSEDVVLGFERREYPNAKRVFVIGPLGDPEAIARNLYHVLRQIDLEGIKEVHVDFDFDQEGVLRTVAERLEKAAHPYASS